MTIYGNVTTGSTGGFSSSDVQVLLSTSYDPSQSIASQFTAFSVGTPSNSYSTLSVTGFDNVTRVFIASSQTVNFDNITTASPAAVPEPSSIVLLGIGGIALIGYARRRKQKIA